MTEVIVYTKPNCVQCKATFRLLDREGIEYAAVDMTVDPDAFTYVKDELGYAQAPVVQVTYSSSTIDHWAGFRPDKISTITTEENA